MLISQEKQNLKNNNNKTTYFNNNKKMQKLDYVKRGK